uniref:Monocarboxylate transporter 2-like n=1 Tax=Scleropages formosus TaxID=113540 RepID=A0A8C9RZI3_SCLFO
MPSAPTTDLGYTPPDGGWGWVVVFGAFISIGFSYAFPKALTIYFKEIQEYFSVSYSDIAWISSIMLAAMYAGGPASSVLVNRYGSRPVVMAGGIMCGVAMVTASFGNTITHLYVCVGVIGGFGLSFNLQPSLTIIGKYFLAKRPVANGLAMAGTRKCDGGRPAPRVPRRGSRGKPRACFSLPLPQSSARGSVG